MADFGMTGRQAAGIAALLTCGTTRAAARQSGIAERTLRRWLTRPEFRQALHAAQDEALSSITRRMTATADQAVDALVDALAVDQPPGIRLAAARLVFTALPGLVDLTDLVERVQRLEAWDTTRIGEGGNDESDYTSSTD
jgi:hypothetical protein